MQSCRRIGGVVAVVVFAASALLAQTTTSIVGTVSDQSGAVMPGATLTLVASDGSVRSAVAGPDGRYRFSEVPPGSYQLRAEMAGFASVTRDVTAGVGQSLTVNLVFPVPAPPPPPPPPPPPAAAPAPPTKAKPPSAARVEPEEPPFVAKTVLYATDRMRTVDKPYGVAYSRERANGGDDDALQYGSAVVTIPRSHQTGVLESPSLLHFEFKADPAKHVILARSERLERATFYQNLHASAEGKELLLFIHGYNVTFENALRRTAQLAYDLQFQGPAVAYTWPGQDNAARYLIAESNVDWCKPHLMRFLQELAERSGATRIHVIVHSLGNRILAHAVDALVATHPEQKALFHNVVMAAADIDVDEFRQLARNMKRSTEQLTLYVSSTDKALLASQKLAKYSRVGQAGANVVLIEGIDTIDATDVDQNFFWDVDHSYFGDSKSVLGDLWELVGCGWKIAERDALQSLGAADPRLWKIVPDAPRRKACGHQD